MFLMIGANSEIGGTTARLLRARGQTVMSTTRRPTDVDQDTVMLDFTSSDDFEVPPGVTAACIFVAVARLSACQADPAGSSLINCERTIALADRLTRAGVYTLFLSTNQVFDGQQPHVRWDAPTSPVSEYGRQKARTEAALRMRMEAGAAIGILRLAKVVSPGMVLIESWRRELVAGRSILAFRDMTMAPTPTDLVAEAIARIMEERDPVVAQLTGPRDLRYADIGRFIAKEVSADEALVEEVSALKNGMPLGATPAHTTLDSSYLAARYGLRCPDVLSVLRAAFNKA